MPLRFHLDESVDHAVAKGLMRRGIYVTTSTETGLMGATDEQQLAFATQAGCVLITHDQDFLRIAATHSNHAGIAYCPPGYRSLGQIILRLAHLSRTNEPNEFLARVEYL